MIEEESQKIFESLEKVSEKTNEFSQKFELGCKTGCGQCCVSHKGAWAKVGEMLPMALHLHELNMATGYLDKIENSKGINYCIAYQPSNHDKNMGKCSMYKYRPSICRMFGSSLSRGKGHLFQGVFCKWQREVYKSRINYLENEGDAQLQEYLASSLNMIVRQAIKLDYLLVEYPINEALKLALEYVIQKSGYSILERQNVPIDAKSILKQSESEIV